MLKAREGIHYSGDEDRTMETLRAKFDSFCPVKNIPYDQNPFYTCVERAGGSELKDGGLRPLISIHQSLSAENVTPSLNVDILQSGESSRRIYSHVFQANASGKGALL